MEKVKVIESVYLENTKNNHNKYYQMIRLNNGKLVTGHGKIGSIQGATVYPERQWHDLFNNKISSSKGYEVVSNVDTFALIEDILNKVGYTYTQKDGVMFDQVKYNSILNKLDSMNNEIIRLINKYPNSIYLKDMSGQILNIKHEVVNTKSFTVDQVNYLNKAWKRAQQEYVE